jgi:hypothetical protein
MPDRYLPLVSSPAVTAVPTTRTVAGAALSGDVSAATLASGLRGAVVDPLTSAGSWTASAGTSGRGSATFGAGGLALGITVGASVTHDASYGGFNAPHAALPLPAGGTRGVRVTMAYSGLTNADNRLALAIRASTRASAMIAIQVNGSTQAVEFLSLAPSTVGRTAGSATGSRSAGALCLEIRAGQVTAFYATTATPTEADWRFVGVATLNTASFLAAVTATHVEVALATYSAVASSATITSCTVESLA